MQSDQQNEETVEVIAITTEELQKILSVGRTAALRIAKNAGARIDLGSSRLVRFNYRKIVDYVEKVTY